MLIGCVELCFEKLIAHLQFIVVVEQLLPNTRGKFEIALTL
jgi:hypothetical protein